MFFVFIGFSLVSIVELIYWFLFRLIFNITAKNRRKTQPTSETEHQHYRYKRQPFYLNVQISCILICISSNLSMLNEIKKNGKALYSEYRPGAQLGILYCGFQNFAITNLANSFATLESILHIQSPLSLKIRGFQFILFKNPWVPWNPRNPR